MSAASLHASVLGSMYWQACIFSNVMYGFAAMIAFSGQISALEMSDGENEKFDCPPFAEVGKISQFGH